MEQFLPFGHIDIVCRQCKLQLRRGEIGHAQIPACGCLADGNVQVIQTGSVPVESDVGIAQRYRLCNGTDIQRRIANRAAAGINPLIDFFHRPGNRHVHCRETRSVDALRRRNSIGVGNPQEFLDLRIRSVNLGIQPWIIRSVSRESELGGSTRHSRFRGELVRGPGHPVEHHAQAAGYVRRSATQGRRSVPETG